MFSAVEALEQVFSYVYWEISQNDDDAKYLPYSGCICASCFVMVMAHWAEINPLLLPVFV